MHATYPQTKKTMSRKTDEPVIKLENVNKRFITEAVLTAEPAEQPARPQKTGLGSFFRKQEHKKEKNNSLHCFYAVSDISLTVQKGEFVLIAGANGSGKTVLMTIIAGLVQPSSGKIGVKEKCGLIFQEADLQILGETPEEDIMLGLKNIKLPREERQRRLNEALDKTGLQNKRKFLSHLLSGGEKRRLAAASILAMDFPIIIFDEPYANLDYGSIRQLNGLILQLKKEGRTLLLLTHELEKCAAMADRLIVLHEGKKVFDGSMCEGLKKDLAQWNIRPPLCTYAKKEDLLWI